MKKIYTAITYLIMGFSYLNAQNSFVNVGESLFEMAKEALLKMDYKRANSLLIDARNNGYCLDSIVKYELHSLNVERIERIIGLYSKRDYKKCEIIYDSIPSEFFLSVPKYSLDRIERLKPEWEKHIIAIDAGEEISRPLALLMNKYAKILEIPSPRGNEFRNGYIKCKINDRECWLNKNGEYIPCINAKIPLGYNRFICQEFGESTFYIGKFHRVKGFTIDDIPSQSDYLFAEYIPVNDEKYKRVKDNYYESDSGNIIRIGEISDSDYPRNIEMTASDYLYVGERRGKYGFKDTTGKWKIKPEYDYACDFHDGYAAVRKKNRWFFINSEGVNTFNLYFPEIKLIIKPIYFDAGFKNGVACVRLYFLEDGKDVKSKWGYITNKGERLTPFIYDEMNFFHDSMAVYKRNNKYGYINIQGKEIVSPIFEDAYDFHDGFGVVKKEGYYGFVDKFGNSTFNFEND